MKPFYEDGCVTIFHGDCLEVLPGLRGVAAVVTDPPYNADYSSRVVQTWWVSASTSNWPGSRRMR